MTKPETAEGQPELKRVMGPGLLLLFVVGDILGTGVYALTGQVAGEVGGAAWLPFLLAFVIATITAFSYLELVTKYPQAAGAALYAHKAFGIHFFTFIVAFVVMCSGITSASTASQAFASNLIKGFGLDWGKVGIATIALLFMAGLAAVNLRGVSESVKLNVGLTIIEITGLLLVIVVGLWAFTQGGDNLDFSRIILFENEDERSTFVAVTAATSLAFFAMVGFEDSVNMAEGDQGSGADLPQSSAERPDHRGHRLRAGVDHRGGAGADRRTHGEQDTAGRRGRGRGAGLADRHVLSIHHDVRRVEHRVDQHADGQQADLRYGAPTCPAPVLGSVHKTRRTPWVAILFTTTIAFGLIFYVSAFASDSAISVLGGTTSLLLLAVFAMVNVAVLVLRRDVKQAGGHFKTPTALPVIGFIASLYLVTPLSGRPGTQYLLAGILLVIGIVLFGITLLINKQLGIKQKGITDPTQLAELPD